MKTQPLCLGLMILLTFSSSLIAEIFPAGVKRVVFLGDSITYDGHYVADIVAYQRLHQPQREMEFINLGLPSENTSGLSEPGHAGGKFPRPDLHERLGRMLAKTRPDLVIACYGMNDGIYLPLDAGRFAAFTNGIIRLHQAVENSGAKIIHVTPPVFDEVPGGHPGYANVLDVYSRWLLDQLTNGWRVIDLHFPMQQTLAAERAKRPAFAFAKDGIHPDEAGHWLMAKEILKGLGATDLAGMESPVGLFQDAATGQRILPLLNQKLSVMKDAWLTEIGHKRPMPAGLPMAEATKRAGELEKQITNLIN